MRAAKELIKTLPTIGDKVINVSQNSVTYDNGHAIANAVIHNNNVKANDVVVSVHVDLEVGNKTLRISVDHSEGGKLVSARNGLQATMRDLKLEDILSP